MADNFRKTDGDHPSLSLGCRFLGARLQRSNLFCLRSPDCSPHLVFDSQEQSHKPLVSGSHSLSSQTLRVPCITSFLLYPFCLGRARLRQDLGWVFRFVYGSHRVHMSFGNHFRTPRCRPCRTGMLSQILSMAL